MELLGPVRRSLCRAVRRAACHSLPQPRKRASPHDLSSGSSIGQASRVASTSSSDATTANGGAGNHSHAGSGARRGMFSVSQRVQVLRSICELTEGSHKSPWRYSLFRIEPNCRCKAACCKCMIHSKIQALTENSNSPFHSVAQSEMWFKRLFAHTNAMP